eukprot:5434859-Alexandrium_andersonii.AAC.1
MWGWPAHASAALVGARACSPQGAREFPGRPALASLCAVRCAAFGSGPSDEVCPAGWRAAFRCGPAGVWVV